MGPLAFFTVRKRQNEFRRCFYKASRGGVLRVFIGVLENAYMHLKIINRILAFCKTPVYDLIIIKSFTGVLVKTPIRFFPEKKNKK